MHKLDIAPWDVSVCRKHIKIGESVKEANLNNECLD